MEENETYTHSQKLMERIRSAPVDAGCYLYKNQSGKIIYIGKAKNLRNRVRSYFVGDKSGDPKTQKLVSKIRDVEFIATHSEVDALILENTLIKKHKPKYNIILRDDKTFPYVRITNEPFPRVFLTRKVISDRSQYFGPFTDVRAVRDTVQVIKNLFSIRTCQHRLDDKTVQSRKIKLCLDYHIKKCDGPCQGLITFAEYEKMIDKVKAFLQGRTRELLAYFQEKMDSASSELRFEDAAIFRDHLETLRQYSNRQAVELNDFEDRDLVYVAIEEDDGCAVVFRVREGKLLAKDSLLLQGVAVHELPEVIRNFIRQYYSEARPVPPEINVNAYPADQEILQEWLSKLRGTKVSITRPGRRDKIRLMKMAEKNARLQLQEFLFKKNQKVEYTPKSLVSLQTDLGIWQLPRRIEAFDISNIRGKAAVASMVSFLNAKADKKEYRKFRIKTVSGIDDFAMMQEVVKRRYTRLIKEEKPLPDVILIDGGKGQLHVAKKVLDSLSLEQIPVIGLAKRLEEIFRPDSAEPITLPRNSISLQLLQKIRDESHRFAITYHRKLRHKGEIESELDLIPRLGKAKKQLMWKRFKTISKMKSASVEEIQELDGIGPKLAESIWNHLHKA